MSTTPSPSLADYPFQSYEKLRYGDTDRQGHVNNAVFSTMLETGRVEFLFASDGPLHDTGCDFVIASLHLDFLNEVNWPGKVDIGTRVLKVGRSSVTLEQGVFQVGVPVARASTVIVQMNRDTRRSHPWGEAALARLQGLADRTAQFNAPAKVTQAK